MMSPVLARRQFAGFSVSVVIIGIGTGFATGLLMRLLGLVQHALWPGSGEDILQAASQAAPWRPIAVLASAGLVTVGSQYLLGQLRNGNGTDIVAAIWFHAGRLPGLRTMGSAVLSVVIVGMGASLGREGAPKQAGAVVANTVADRAGSTDDTRRLLVACGAGAGMAAAYGVPVGGALFALEVLRGDLALRFVLPALVTSLVSVGVSRLLVPDLPTYDIPVYHGTLSSLVWALLAGPVLGVVAVGYIRGVAWCGRHKPKGRWNLVAPVLALTLLGVVAIRFPQLLGNGRDVAELAFVGQVAPLLLLTLAVLKPAATLLCLGSGAPGGLFTPSLAFGALLGGALGTAWGLVWPGDPAGLFAVLGAAAMLAATTQGPVSSVVLMMEMTAQARGAVVPMLLAVALATLVSRTIDPRSVYDAKLGPEDVAKREKQRNAALRDASDGG